MLVLFRTTLAARLLPFPATLFPLPLIPRGDPAFPFGKWKETKELGDNPATATVCSRLQGNLETYADSLGGNLFAPANGFSHFREGRQNYQ